MSVSDIDSWTPGMLYDAVLEHNQETAEPVRKVRQSDYDNF